MYRLYEITRASLCDPDETVLIEQSETLQSIRLVEDSDHYNGKRWLMVWVDGDNEIIVDRREK